ncbi:AAA family ATPase [uncultured Sulfitobacter sp.]|uniref:AAA family ATPase n=1 Tax=uncultured Sulfitobacter sp. TaxID=191468 RepID=UPI0030D8BF6F
MKIRAITLNNVRRFTDPAQVTGIGDGINVLSEPNEHGKSTLFDAIQALFFKPFGSRDKEVAALRPHAGGAPEVTIEVETDEGRFAVHKRWFQKPLATVHRDGRLIAQADEAEAWIAQLLGGDAGGPSGLIWVRQGMTALTGGSTKEEKLALEARRDLMTSVGAEVEAMTGGRRMDKALAQCRDELAQYATGTGRPRTGGPWKEAQDQVEALTATRDQLAATARELQDALAERQRARRALADLEAPKVVEERRQKLEAARAAHAAATRHAEELETLARAVDLARLTAESATSRLDSYRAVEIEQQAAAPPKPQPAKLQRPPTVSYLNAAPNWTPQRPPRQKPAPPSKPPRTNTATPCGRAPRGTAQTVAARLRIASKRPKRPAAGWRPPVPPRNPAPTPPRCNGLKPFLPNSPPAAPPAMPQPRK